MPAIETYAPTDAEIANYREQGFVRLRGLLTPDEVARFRAAAIDAIRAQRGRFFSRNDALEQAVNLWEFDDAMRALTLHPRLVAACTTLAGVPLRLWHDQALIKHPGGTPTVPHQGQPNWGHECRADSHGLTAWIALTDAPIERGVMGFVPGSHLAGSRGKQHQMTGPRALYDLAPEMEWAERVFLPLRAGDITVHHCYTVHAAGGNLGAEARIGHIVDFIDRDTRANGDWHAVTEDLGFAPGDLIEGERFPLV